MATLTDRSLDPEPPAPNGWSQEPESWGLLLIPVLLCIGMLIFALATKALPAPTEVPASRPASPATTPAQAAGQDHPQSVTRTTVTFTGTPPAQQGANMYGSDYLWDMSRQSVSH